MVIKDTEFEPCYKLLESESPGMWPRNMHFINLPIRNKVAVLSSILLSDIIDFIIIIF